MSLLQPSYSLITTLFLQLTVYYYMVHFETHNHVITSNVTITTDFHYYITTYYFITTIIHLSNLEMIFRLRSRLCPIISQGVSEIQNIGVKSATRSGTNYFYPRSSG